jgi:alpha-L-rhamnosidase
MRRYVDYMISKSYNGLVRFGLGDWVPPFGDPEDYTAPLALLTSVYFFLDTRVLSLAAGVLGRKEEARQYADWAARIRERFNQRFYDPASGLYASGSQTALSMALYAHLPEPAERMKVARQLVAEVRQQKGRINAGIHGTKAIINALAEHGFHAQAFKLITQPQFPSWTWWLEQGATTLWENWDGSASRNHIMYGDISAWFFRYLAGIRPDPEGPGFKLVIFRPYLADGLDWVKAEHESPYGTVSSHWQREGKHFRLEVRLPPNTAGLVYLPEMLPGSGQVDGRELETAGDVQITHQRIGGTVCRIGSGSWLFECELE